jgi:hypothetical protein
VPGVVGISETGSVVESVFVQAHGTIARMRKHFGKTREDIVMS